jgi:EAL domain-containing protein (putative c-di-GMP-specific phosphodiesterase class I)
VLFQPQVAIASGRVTGVEALARWHHPRLGEVGAEPLFAAAQRIGLEAALSDHVQRRALSGAAQWPSSLAKLRLSINVTAGDLARPNFADALLGRVDSSGFPRNRLTVEVTEGGIMADLSEAARLLAELRGAGCRVAIDDFGTGYSSLAYLKALPLDYLKIDKKLSQDIEGSARDRVVVRGVIDMARSLGLAVVAEGVETEAQLDLLAKEGCQYFQGYLCAEPLDVPALTRLVLG